MRDALRSQRPHSRRTMSCSTLLYAKPLRRVNKKSYNLEVFPSPSRVLLPAKPEIILD